MGIKTGSIQGLARAAAGAVALFAVTVLGAMALGAGPLLAQPYERPPAFDIGRVTGIKPAAENYAVGNPARSDGLLRLYSLTTSYGDFTVHGDHMLRMRQNELAALAELEKISNSESFGKALVDAGLSPLRYTGKFITNPAKTVGDTLGGIGAMFGRISSDINNMGKTPGGAIEGLLGVTDQKRKLAASLGVDPYTDFEPLSVKLSRLAEAAAAGGLTVSATLMVVPGAAGIVVSNLSTASSLQDTQIEEMARDYTVAQIFDRNRQRLVAMGADRDTIEALLANRNYTPVDMAVIVAALDSMPTVDDRTVFLERAVAIDNRSIAYFMRRHAEMLANHYARGARFARFVSLGGYPFNVTNDGRIVGIVPLDALSWTEATAAIMRDSAADARRSAPNGRVELRISGTATALARKELAALGWRVSENTRF